MGPRDASIIRDAYGNAGQRTGSLRNAVGAHPERFVICVQTPQWRPEESLPLASCQRPHPWEFLRNLISVDEDLSEAARQREGLRLCTARAAVRPDVDQLRIHPDLDVTDLPAPPGRLPGLCRIERKSGLLPPLSDLYLWSP